MNFYEWLKIGMENNWCGPVVCETHDGLPLSHEEEEMFWETDPCISIIRLYDSLETKEKVEANHSPSQWRKR